jgi:hypothetical protein
LDLPSNIGEQSVGIVADMLETVVCAGFVEAISIVGSLRVYLMDVQK